MWQEDMESVFQAQQQQHQLGEATSSNNELVSDRHGLAQNENGGHLSDFTDFSTNR